MVSQLLGPVDSTSSDGLPEFRYRALLDAIDEGFCIVQVLFDAHGCAIDYRFLEVNAAFERQTGLADAPGRRMRELAPGHEEHWFEIYGRVALTGEPVRFEKHAHALDRWFDVFAFRVDASEAHHVAILFTDVTERKRVEQALTQNDARLRQAAEALQEANRRKDDFLTTLAHELRNPLAPIRNGVHLLRRLAAGRPDLIGVVDMMDRQVAQVVRLVDDLLDVGRIARGKVALRREPVDLRELLRSTLESMQGTLDARQHTVQVSMEPHPVIVEGDPDRLMQVLANLISNAVKFTPPRGTVWVELVTANDWALLSVRDTGIGIAPDKIEGVFDLFSQAHGPSGNDGLGIGLALVRGLVHRHGGTVIAESDGEGCGSCFTVRLPLAMVRSAG